MVKALFVPEQNRQQALAESLKSTAEVQLRPCALCLASSLGLLPLNQTLERANASPGKRCISSCVKQMRGYISKTNRHVANHSFDREKERCNSFNLEAYTSLLSGL
jgi:hypothetical protein